MNTKKKSASMSSKTLLYLIVFSVCILLSLWFFQIVYIKYSYRDYQLKKMDSLAKSIENSNFSNTLKKLESIAYEDEVCMEYHIGDKIYYYNTLMNGCALGKNNETILSIENAFLQSDQKKRAHRLVNEDYNAEAYLYEIKVGDGAVFLYRTLEDVSKANVLLKNQLIYLTIIAIIFACMIAYFLSKKLTSSLQDVTKKARKLGSGVPVDFPTYDILEVNELSSVLTSAQSEMLKTDELRRDLLANVSHDLKTPLTMIKAYAEMVRDISYKDDKKREEHLNIIIDETDRLNILVNDLLELSKLQANAEVINLETFDLILEINSILKRYEIIKETENYHFILQAPKKALVVADRKKINQVIYNLINNAINYTGDDKTVSITIKKTRDSYGVFIKDSGKGIEESELPFIWDKYYKNDKNHKRNVVSSGIGLSIVKSILVSHNFKYGVESKINSGTTFYFYIKKK